MPDLATLTAPIAEDDPCGEDMSLSPEFDAILEARRADDPSLDQGDWIKELKVADWGKVEDLCVRLLSGRTKDIRLCVWLTEAWARSEGFSGLASGYRMLARLCAADWESLHPLADDGDEEARINNVSRLLQLSIPLMKQQPITASDSGRFSLFDLETARHTVQQTRGSDDYADDNTEAVNRLAQFESARRDTPGVFYASLVEELEDFRAAMDELETVLDEKLGPEAPGFGHARGTLDGIYRMTEGFAGDAGVERGAPAQQAALDNAVEDGASPPEQPCAGTAGASPTPIKSRAQALSQLRLVADFFRRTEPHSPVAYLADTAASWGNMPLHSWLRNVIRDEGELAHMEELLGLTKTDREGGSDDSFR